MGLFGKNLGVRAFVALPFALRVKLGNRYLSGLVADPLERARSASRHVPFYRQLYHNRIPTCLEDLPLVTDEVLAASAPAALRDGRSRKAATMVRNSRGAPAFFTQDELVGLGAVALRHPKASQLADAVRHNPACLNGLPHQGTILGRCGEGLARSLGACVLNLPAAEPAEVARELVATMPSLVLGTTGQLISWLMAVRARDEASYDKVVNSLQFFVNMDLRGPAGRTRSALLERTFAIDVIDLFTDGFSFAFLSCQCGAIHPSPLTRLEVMGTDGQPGASAGTMVVTDLTARIMPLIRYLTPFHVRVSRTGCPFFGHTQVVEAAGLTGEVWDGDHGTWGRNDLEQQLASHGLVADFQLHRSASAWTIKVVPFDPLSFDVEGARKGIEKRFGIKTKVSA